MGACSSPPVVQPGSDAGSGADAEQIDAGSLPVDAGSTASDAGTSVDAGPDAGTPSGQWQSVALGSGADLGAVWADTSAGVWIVSATSGLIFNRTETAWTSTSTPDCAPGGQNPTPMAATVWGDSAGSIWTAGCPDFGNNGVLRWKNGQWSPFDLHDNRYVTAIGGSGPDDVWGYGWLYLGHWDGTSWSHIDSVHDANSIWDDHGSIWAAAGALDDSSGGTLTHFDGTTTGAAMTFPHALLSVHGTSSSDIWAVGLAGTILHYDGTSWMPVTSPTDSALRAVWAASHTDAWAVGDGGGILHYDGMMWRSFSSPTTQTLRGLSGTGPNAVWAAGDNGTVLHWSG